MENKFYETRVVTKDFFRDWLQNLRSLIGMRMVSYEKNIEKNIKEVFEKIEKKGEIKWYRINQDVIADGIIITIYGEYNEY